MLAAAGAAKADAPAAVPVESPVGQLRLAVEDLSLRVNPAESVFTRYVSIFNVPKESRPNWRRSFRLVLNKTSMARVPVPEFEVPGSDGTLFRLNVATAPNWTRVAWALVADRDYLFREVPFGPLPHRETQYGRLVTGAQQNPKTFAAGFLLNGPQLFRDLLESDRAASSYDLLYGLERHPDPDAGDKFVAVGDAGPEPVRPAARPWAGGVWPLDGKVYPAGAFEWVPQAELDAWKKAHAAWSEKARPKTGRVLPARPVSVADAGKGKANFPETGVEFERKWGAEVGKDELAKLLIDPRVGGIAAGRESDDKTGSFVALHDRAIRLVQTRFGWAGRTYDVFENTGDKDHLSRFREIALGDAKADGGELLASLPNGGQASLLVNGEDKRVEIAATTLAQIFSDKIDTRYRDVRNGAAGSCFGCHGVSNGFIPFVERFKEMVEKGVKANVYDPVEAQKVTDFYFGLERQIKGWQNPYASFLEVTTRDGKGKSWTGAEAWVQVRGFRDAYDAPVTLEVAAVEVGLPVEVLRQRIMGPREGQGAVEARLNQLATGQKVPRRTWERDTFSQLCVFLDASKPGAAPPLVDPKVLEAGYAKFGVKP